MNLKGDVSAVDGKVIRSTVQKDKPHSALQILTAYLTENGVILVQEKIHEKTNEIPVFQEMMTYLNLKDKTVTADAMHCQRDTCAMILDKGGHYLNRYGIDAQITVVFHMHLRMECLCPKSNACTQILMKQVCVFSPYYNSIMIHNCRCS